MYLLSKDSIEKAKYLYDSSKYKTNHLKHIITINTDYV